MGFLTDSQIAALIAQEASLAPDCREKSAGTRDPRLKAASLDLTIGDIFIPGSCAGKLGAHDKPRKEISLMQGASAIVRTAEKVQVPDDHGGIAFPPARLSLTGLLTTNPGLLDPGYEGTLHLTLINMGKEPISLKTGDRIVRILFFKMEQKSTEPYRSDPNASHIDEELLMGLSYDFANLQERAREVAKEEVHKAEIFSKWYAPVIGSVIAVIVTILTAIITNNQVDPLESRIDRIEGRFGQMGGDLNLDSIEERLRQLEEVGDTEQGNLKDAEAE
ncbi:dCTP deaminase domain-containing protein [Altererythrobacter sp. MF3-039]|uniref:dCTP deaminase domain-containing protein n=1 Tax=Altererythrobacter sp. MF3-039 TaxID=3252901 RepID=UPI00390C42EF